MSDAPNLPDNSRYMSWPRPYQAPPPEPPPPAAPRLRLAGTSAQLALALTLLTHIGLIVAVLLRYRLVGRIETEPGSVTVTDAEASDHRVSHWAIAVVVASALCAIAWLVWFARARRAGEAYGGQFRHSRGWAVGAWFVPFLNLVRPVQITTEIERAVVPRVGRRSVAPVVIAAWWTTLLLGNVLGRVSAAYGASAESLRHASIVQVVSEVFVIAAAMLAITVVQLITSASDCRLDAAAKMR